MVIHSKGIKGTFH